MPDHSNIFPASDPIAIRRAAQILRTGGLVGMPTKTVYGLAAHAMDPQAVARVFAAKDRPSFDPLIVHVADLDQARTFAQFSNTAERLADAFWPGALTMVLPRHRPPKETQDGAPPTRDQYVPDLVTAGLDTVGVRVPAHPAAQALLQEAALPIAAPSANRFGSISPTTAEHVAAELGNRVDLILDGGPCAQGVESTVVGFTPDGVRVLRLGATSIEAIQEVIGGRVEIAVPSSSPGQGGDDDAPKVSPGMTQRHYAPRTPMRLLNSLNELTRIDPASRRVGLIGMGAMPVEDDARALVKVCNLSPAGDLSQAASGLFAALRDLDDANLDLIVAIAMPDRGLGRAINDRLGRGCVR